MKPPLNEQKAKRKELLDREERLLEAIFADDAHRAAVDAGFGHPRSPMSVWVDSDRSWPESTLQPCELPKWEKLSERTKIFIGMDVALEFGWSYSLTANLSRQLVESWEANEAGFAENIIQRLRRALADQGSPDIPFCYVLEAHTKNGKARTHPHMHGVAICINPRVAMQFRAALKAAFAKHVIGPLKGKAVDVRRSYVMQGHPLGRFRWVSYMTKNTDIYDPRFKRRRVYMSRDYNQIARMGWAVRRDDRLSFDRSS